MTRPYNEENEGRHLRDSHRLSTLCEFLKVLVDGGIERYGPVTEVRVSDPLPFYNRVRELA